jgi:hypothetical protein
MDRVDRNNSQRDNNPLPPKKKIYIYLLGDVPPPSKAKDRQAEEEEGEMVSILACVCFPPLLNPTVNVCTLGNQVVIRHFGPSELTYNPFLIEKTLV